MDKIKPGELCEECGKAEVVEIVDTVVDRFEMQALHVCKACAKKCYEINRMFAN